MIWSSSLLLYGHPHQALLAATLLLLLSRGRPGSSQKPSQGPPEVKGMRQRERLNSGCIYPYFLGSGQLHVLQHKHRCSQHIPASRYSYLLRRHPARLCEP